MADVHESQQHDGGTKLVSAEIEWFEEGLGWRANLPKGVHFTVLKTPDAAFGTVYPATMYVPSEGVTVIQHRARELGEAQRFCLWVARAQNWI
jgi:hypothetical protein